MSIFNLFKKRFTDKTPLELIRSEANSISSNIKFTDEALMTLTVVPHAFLPTVLKGCVNWAIENNVELITAEHMAIISKKKK